MSAVSLQDIHTYVQTYWRPHDCPPACTHLAHRVAGARHWLVALFPDHAFRLDQLRQHAHCGVMMLKFLLLNLLLILILLLSLLSPMFVLLLSMIIHFPSPPPSCDCTSTTPTPSPLDRTGSPCTLTALARPGLWSLVVMYPCDHHCRGHSDFTAFIDWGMVCCAMIDA